MRTEPPDSTSSAQGDDHEHDDAGLTAPGADWVKEQRGSASAAGAGMQFGLTICLFALLGNWLDGRLGSSPWLLLAGVLLGFGGGTVSLLKKFG